MSCFLKGLSNSLKAFKTDVSGDCWNSLYNLLCKEECESLVGEGLRDAVKTRLLGQLNNRAAWKDASKHTHD